MSQAGSQAWAFYREVARSGIVWTTRDEGGFPAPPNPYGRRAQPFWSSRKRVEKIIESVPTYAHFEPYKLTWTEFAQKWVPNLTRTKMLVGVNWTGKRAVGFDLEPVGVKRSIEAVMSEIERSGANGASP